jgi:radial spoke head protein 4/6
MSSEDDFSAAKAYLSQASTASGLSVYDHLSSVISALLDERPNNAVDSIEDLSAKLKRERFEDTSSTLKVCIFSA